LAGLGILGRSGAAEAGNSRQREDHRECFVHRQREGSFRGQRAIIGAPIYWPDRTFPPPRPRPMKFQGSENYVATQDLMLAVKAAITLKRPLLVKGEPGTGKTMLAEEVASALKMPLLQWHVKTTTKAQQGLYEYDAVSRLRDSQLNTSDSAERVKD